MVIWWLSDAYLMGYVATHKQKHLIALDHQQIIVYLMVIWWLSDGYLWEVSGQAGRFRGKHDMLWNHRNMISKHFGAFRGNPTPFKKKQAGRFRGRREVSGQAWRFRGKHEMLWNQRNMCFKRFGALRGNPSPPQKRFQDISGHSGATQNDLSDAD